MSTNYRLLSTRYKKGGTRKFEYGGTQFRIEWSTGKNTDTIFWSRVSVYRRLPDWPGGAERWWRIHNWFNIEERL